jgi:hypothetical protein
LFLWQNILWSSFLLHALLFQSTGWSWKVTYTHVVLWIERSVNSTYSSSQENICSQITVPVLFTCRHSLIHSNNVMYSMYFPRTDATDMK